MKGILGFIDKITGFINGIVSFIKSVVQYVGNGVKLIVDVLAGLPVQFRVLLGVLTALALAILVINILRDVF